MKIKPLRAACTTSGCHWINVFCSLWYFIGHQIASKFFLTKPITVLPPSLSSPPTSNYSLYITISMHSWKNLECHGLDLQGEDFYQHRMTCSLNVPLNAAPGEKYFISRDSPQDPRSCFGYMYQQKKEILLRFLCC